MGYVAPVKKKLDPDLYTVPRQVCVERVSSTEEDGPSDQ